MMWLICLLHTNELPLRYFITNLVRNICGKDCFSGVYGVIGSGSFIITTNRTIYCM